jgi:hypothetical protein
MFQISAGKLHVIQSKTGPSVWHTQLPRISAGAMATRGEIRFGNTMAGELVLKHLHLGTQRFCPETRDRCRSFEVLRGFSDG